MAENENTDSGNVREIVAIFSLVRSLQPILKSSIVSAFSLVIEAQSQLLCIVASFSLA